MSTPVRTSGDPAPKPSHVNPPPQDTGTEYIILTKKAEGWQQNGTRTARSADAAIRDFLSTANSVQAEGMYLAIPARSFKPVTVKVETTTTAQARGQLMTWREKTVVAILLLVARMLVEEGFVAAEIKTLATHIAVTAPKPDEAS